MNIVLQFLGTFIGDFNGWLDWRLVSRLREHRLVLALGVAVGWLPCVFLGWLVGSDK